MLSRPRRGPGVVAAHEVLGQGVVAPAPEKDGWRGLVGRLRAARGIRRAPCAGAKES